jgi:predicted nuclease of predicted toxin-antitoxin system
MRFAADENFDGRILKGLLERLPELDIVRVQDTDIYQAPDPKLLDWLASEGRILLTHDLRTMPDFVYKRLNVGKPVPGVIEVHVHTPIGAAIDELELMIGAGKPEDFENLICYIPNSLNLFISIGTPHSCASNP